MATFRNYDRLLFVKTETTEGTVNAPDVGDYIETISPSYNITNRAFIRDVTRSSISPLPKTVPGGGDTTPSSIVEFTFGVELAGTGEQTSTTWATEPRWSTLMKACGFEVLELWKTTIEPAAASPNAAKGIFDATASARTPYMMRNRSWVSNEGGSGSAFDAANKMGRLIGDLNYDDPYAYITPAGATVAAGSDGDRWFSQAAGGITACAPYFTSDASAGTMLKRGYGFSLISNSQLGGSGAANTSSCSIALQLGTTGQFVRAQGCRGNVEFVFTAGDRCVMQFTMQGVLEKYSDAASAAVPTMVTQAVPPTIVGISAAMNSSGFGGTGNTEDMTNTIFQDFSINMGNQLAVREDMNSADGYEACYITGREPSFTFAPDATPASTTHVPFWDRMLSGELTRVRMALGAGNDANSFEFKMPSVQFETLGDADRDEVTTYDLVGSLTGGDNGSTVNESPTETAVTSTVRNTRLGTNNEFTLIYT
jgi:hypothetical protein